MQNLITILTVLMFVNLLEYKYMNILRDVGKFTKILSKIEFSSVMMGKDRRKSLF